jgi:DNA-binding response OmpR family regulator
VSAGPLIVCADDDEDILSLVAMRLAQAGYEVQKAEDGDSALAAIRSRRPVLVVLDVMMPRRGGLEVLAELRRDPELRDIKVIMLSARVQEPDVARGLAAGADAYLLKPFKFADLVDKVGELLAS